MTQFLRITDAIAWLASVVSRLMLTAVAVFPVLQVILRFGFGFSRPWPEDASRYLMIWIVMLSAGLLVKDNELVRVDFLDKLRPERLLVWRNLVFRVLMISMFAVLAYYGWDQATFSARRATAGMQISWFWPYLAIPRRGGADPGAAGGGLRARVHRRTLGERTLHRSSGGYAMSVSLLIIIGILLALLFFGSPVIFAIGVAGIAYFFIEPGMTSMLSIVVHKFFTGMDVFIWLSIPLFVIAGEIMSATNMTERLLGFTCTKGGVDMLTRLLANVLGDKGITANAVAPTPVDTPMILQVHGPKDRAIWDAQIPAQRYAKPEEVAAAIKFLASDEAAYINGHILNVDGGFMASGVILRD